MANRLSVYIQYLLPQHLLTRTMGWLATIQKPKIKNKLINHFIHKYSVDMTQASCEQPENFKDFNSFFIRKLKPALRPIAPDKHAIASPVDGSIASIGHIQNGQLLQAKKMYYSLESLLGGDIQLAETFHQGSFATFYLAPRDYHRIHMPLAGVLEKTIYIPGKLFSVNRMTSELIPNLYARNERVVTLFDTQDAGHMAIILIGAMIVGSIQTTWMKSPFKANHIQVSTPDHPIKLSKGAELGHFKLGSTVIVLFGHKKMQWLTKHSFGSNVHFGEHIGNILTKSNTS